MPIYCLISYSFSIPYYLYFWLSQVTQQCVWVSCISVFGWDGEEGKVGRQSSSS